MKANASLPKKVLILGWPESRADGGGAGVACSDLIRQLKKAGCEILAITPNAETQPRESCAQKATLDSTPTLRINPYSTIEDVASIIEHVQAPTSEYEEPHLEPEPIDSAMRKYASKIVEEMKEAEFEPEIIHAHDWLAGGVAEVVAESVGVPVVVHVHSTEKERQPGTSSSAICELEHQVFNKAQLIVSVSNRSAAILRDRYGIAPDQIEVIEPGASAIPSLRANDSRQFPEFTVLFLGRITHQKGPFYFLEVAAQLLATDQNWRFVVAGEGDALPQLIQETANLGLMNRVHFCGSVSQTERSELFDMADVLVSPSVSEPFGLVPLEAIRSGLPVIASRQSGIAEWLPELLLVDYWDTAEVCRRLRAYREDPAETLAALSLACGKTDELSNERSLALLTRCYRRARQDRQL